MSGSFQPRERALHSLAVGHSSVLTILSVGDDCMGSLNLNLRTWAVLARVPSCAEVMELRGVS